MGFRFSYLCDLLSNLEKSRHLRATAAAKTQDPYVSIISHWCYNHAARIHDKGTDLRALLSCLFPEKRTDRVYHLQQASLARVIARCLFLGTSRIKELDRWRSPTHGEDLGQCVENVMRQAENPPVAPSQEVTVEEIDRALDKIASRCRFSGPNVRKQQQAAVDVEAILGSLYRRLSSRDAKWLTRMILKSYHPVILPTNVVLRHIHFLLPHLLLFQDSYDAAVDLLKTAPLNLLPPRPQNDTIEILNESVLPHFVPRMGCKVGRPDYWKARNIRHCCQMVGKRRMSLDRKYDGEYCQIHIDMSRGPNCIQIFSKSGKDSTADRAGIHDVIKRALRIGEPDCKVSQICILEGELLVWSDQEKKILEFSKLRKFLTRSGKFLGADQDSQPKPYEHLMIVFFDILMLDDRICLAEPFRKRRLLLKDTIKVVPGRSEIAEQEIIDFARADAPRLLQQAFARSIAERWEGYVLKACDEPYFAILAPNKNDGYCRWIKLKKDYIPGLGDTADFAIIGARYVPKDAQKLGHIQKLLWTHFHLGCLENKDSVRRFGALPRFRIVDVIGLHNMSSGDMQILNQWGAFYACSAEDNATFEAHSILSDIPTMDVAFRTPFVVEVLGSGFEKPANAQFYTLRFPRVLKIHWDRSYEDAISFAELQDLAEKARSAPEDEIAEEAAFLRRLDAMNVRSEHIIDYSQITLSDASPTTPSPVKSASCPPDSGGHGRESRTHVRMTRDGNVQFSSPCPSPSQQRARKRPFSEVAPSVEHACAISKRCKTGSSISCSQLTSNVSEHQPVLDKPVIMPHNPPTSVASISFLKPTVPVSETHTKSMPSLQESTMTSSNNHDINTDREALSIGLETPLQTVPVYVSDFLFTNPSHAQRDTFCQSSRDFTFSPSHFVQSMASGHTRRRLAYSNPSAAESETALGIVLVDARSGPQRIAREIMRIGNEVAGATRSSSNGSLRLPRRGCVLVLDYDILAVGDGVADRRWLLVSYWEEHGPRHFHASIVWGYGDSSRSSEKEELRDTSTKHDDPEEKTDVVTSWDPEDSSVMGEFISLKPLVHVSGRRYHDVSAGADA